MAIRKTKLDGLGLEQSLANNDIKKNGHWVTKSGEHIISNHASEAHRFSIKDGKVHFDSAVRGSKSESGAMGYAFGTTDAKRRKLNDKSGLSGYTDKQARHFTTQDRDILITRTHPYQIMWSPDHPTNRLLSYE